MRSKRLQKIFLYVFLLSCMTSGCGSFSDMNQSNTTVNFSADDTGMGRYTEKISDLPNDLSGSVNNLFKLTDGSLILANTTAPFLISKNNGETWLSDERAWQSRLLDNGNYIIDVALGSDNTTAVIYESCISDAETDSLFPKLLLVDPNGTEIPVTVGPANNEQYPDKIFITDNGRIFVTAFSQGSYNIYEVTKDGNSQLFLAMDEKAPDQLLMSDHLMIIYGAEYEYPLIYDVMSETYLEDPVLSDFVATHNTDMSFSTESKNLFYDDVWYLSSGPKGSIYLAGQTGLYRHTIGGNAIEQIIDGSLSVLNDPSYSIAGIALLDDNEFLAVFHNRKLVHFTYDPNIPTKPSEMLRVYSLENNDSIRQAITLYRADNPDVYIEYDIGMSDDDAVTKEDAIKKLNTEIMAGNGPDVLIIDNLPFSSYIEKGILKDLSPILEESNYKETLFTNVMDAMKSDDGKIYALPCEIQLPILFGNQSVISQMNDLESIADTIESMQQEYPGQDLLGIYTEEDIIRLLTVVSAPSWTIGKDTINTQNISVFLEQTKRIYDAQNENFTKEQPEIYVVGTQRKNLIHW